MNIIAIAPSFLLLFVLMLGSSNGLPNIKKLLEDKCNKENSFVVSMMQTAALKAADIAADKMCTGSLIKLNWVITTASCFFRFLRRVGAMRSFPNVTVRAGFDPATGTFQERTLSRYILHDKKANEDSETDDPILIELNEPFDASSKVSAIKLATKSAVEKCKEAETVSPLPVPQEGGSRGLITNLLKRMLIRKVCRTIKLVTCSWLKSKMSLCGETKPKKWWNRFTREADEPGCEGAEGSPLICGGALIGIESKCKRGGARSDLVQSSFVRLDPFLDFLASSVGARSLTVDDKEDSNKKKNKDNKKPNTNKIQRGDFVATSGADFFDGASWKMAAGIGAVLFIYF